MKTRTRNNERGDSIDAFSCGIFLSLLIAAIISGLNSSWRSQAVEKGAAEWYLDGSQAEWRWKADRPKPAPTATPYYTPDPLIIPKNNP